MSYSQNEEEDFILQAVGDRMGTVLDIGAYDGKTRSNSLALIERGWKAVLVEPSPKPFTDLLALHGHRDTVVLVNAIVGLRRDIVPIYLSDDGLSTTEWKNYQTWRGLAHFKPVSFAVQVTIDDLIRAFPELSNVDVVSIDTEGTSFELFRTFPFDLCIPKVFCIETDGAADEIEDLARRRSYVPIYASGENIVIERDKAA